MFPLLLPVNVSPLGLHARDCVRRANAYHLHEVFEQKHFLRHFRLVVVDFRDRHFSIRCVVARCITLALEHAVQL